MLLIPCPYCGPRDVTEFSYGGDGNVREPTEDRAEPGTESDAVPTASWSAYVFLRDNPRGPHQELWQHSAGCRRWIQVKRNTLTHEVLGATPAKPS